MFSLHHIAYTRKDLQDLWKKLAALPAEINIKRDALGEHTAELTKLELMLAELVKNEIKPNQDKLDAVQARIDVLTLPAKLTQLDLDIAAHTKKAAEFSPQQKSLSDTIKLIDAHIAELELAVKLVESRELVIKRKAVLDAMGRAIDARQLELKKLQSQLGETLQRKQSLMSQLESVRGNFASDAQHAGDGYESSAQGEGGYSSSQQSSDDASMLENEYDEVQAQGDEIDRNIHQLESECGSMETSKNKLSAEVSQMSEEIDGYARKLVDFKFTDNLPALRELMRQEVAKKTPLDKQLVQVTNSLDFHSSKLEALKSELAATNKRLEQARPLSEPHRDNYNLANLKTMLAACNAQADAYEAKRRLKVNEIENQQKKIAADEDEMKRKNLQLQMIQQNKFLMDLRDKPAACVDALQQRLKQGLKEYRNDHPEDEDVSVRSCLLTLKNKMNFILQQSSVPGGDAKESYRQQFYQASGLLWDAHRQTVKKSASFAVMLEQVLGEDVIQDADAISVYAPLKEANKQSLRDFSKEEIKLYDESEFAKASKKFSDLLKSIPAKASRAEKYYYRKGEILLAAIHAQKELTKKRGNFDIKLHTEILNVASKLLLSPDNTELCDRLSELGKHKLDGRYSIAKNVIGAIGAFVGGALLIIGGIAMAGFLPGIGWPAASGMIAGGATLFAGGIALCVNGREKGTTKALENFDKARASVVKGSITKFMDMFQSPSPVVKRKDEKNADAGALRLASF